jgi:hypothetical protein
VKNIRIWQMAAILAVGIALACGDRGDGTRAEIEQAAKRSAGDAEQAAREMARDADKGAAARGARAVVTAAREVADDVEADGVEATADSAAKTLDDNVERSLQVGEETYDAARADGENDVEAAGDAYDAILAEPGDPNAAE